MDFENIKEKITKKHIIIGTSALVLIAGGITAGVVANSYDEQTTNANITERVTTATTIATTKATTTTTTTVTTTTAITTTKAEEKKKDDSKDKKDKESKADKVDSSKQDNNNTYNEPDYSYSEDDYSYEEPDYSYEEPNYSYEEPVNHVFSEEEAAEIENELIDAFGEDDYNAMMGWDLQQYTEETN